MITKIGSKRVKPEWANGKGRPTQQAEVDTARASGSRT